MKKLCAGILSILLIFSLLPLAALGDETTTTTGSSSGFTVCGGTIASPSPGTLIVEIFTDTPLSAMPLTSPSWRRP